MISVSVREYNDLVKENDRLKKDYKRMKNIEEELRYEIKAYRKELRMDSLSAPEDRDGLGKVRARLKELPNEAD